jgi:arginyl-tRNA synthetase
MSSIQILKEGDAYGKNNEGKGEKVLVEYVSANPTGDLHCGHARGAAWGDALCRLLAEAGYDVTREYYVNDAGHQIDMLAESMYSADTVNCSAWSIHCRKMAIMPRILLKSQNPSRKKTATSG